MFQPHTNISPTKPLLQIGLQSKAVPSGASGNEIVFSAVVIVRDV